MLSSNELTDLDSLMKVPLFGCLYVSNRQVSYTFMKSSDLQVPEKLVGALDLEDVLITFSYSNKQPQYFSS